IASSPVESQTTANRQELKLLRVFLAEATRKTGTLVVTLPSLGAEEVVIPTIESLDTNNLEEHLRTVVSRMPIPGRLIRLNLPKGLTWTADELLTYAKAEATLFRKQLQDARSEYVDILGQSFTKDQATPAIEALNLRPVYVITYGKPFFGGTWQTTYGKMVLQQRGNRVTGTYSTGSGIIEGVVMGTELRVTWQEPDNGTSGFGSFVISEDGMSFSGPWYNNTDLENQAGIWTGTRASEAQRGKTTSSKSSGTS
ncbi:MAG: hypothetical protein H7Y17_06935, partial [Chlorobia bacterium]|nr:hypothetical protein [Fimbriimonadaceae bacterium]